MTRRILATMTAAVAIAWINSGVSGTMETIKTLDAITGENYLWILAAKNVLTQDNLDLSHYAIVLAREDAARFAIFIDRREKKESQQNFAVQWGTDGKMTQTSPQPIIAKLSQIETIDSIDGNNFRAVQVAADVFRRQLEANLANYKLEILREDKSVIVVFADKERKVGDRGHNTIRPGFEVELEEHNFKVLRSNFTR